MNTSLSQMTRTAEKLSEQIELVVGQSVLREDGTIPNNGRNYSPILAATALGRMLDTTLSQECYQITARWHYSRRTTRVRQRLRSDAERTMHEKDVAPAYRQDEMFLKLRNIDKSFMFCFIRDAAYDFAYTKQNPRVGNAVVLTSLWLTKADIFGDVVVSLTDSYNSMNVVAEFDTVQHALWLMLLDTLHTTLQELDSEGLTKTVDTPWEWFEPVLASTFLEHSKNTERLASMHTMIDRLR